MKHPLQRGTMVAAALAAILVLLAGGLALLWRASGTTAAPIPTTAADRAHIANAWNTITLWKHRLAAHYADTGTWPADLSEFGDPAADVTLVVSSPQPHVLVARVKSDADHVKALRGLAVEQRMNPDTSDWRCVAGTPALPQAVLPLNCLPLPAVPSARSEALLALIAACALALVGLALYVVVRHPALGPVQRDPTRLPHTPITLLPRIDRGLRWLRRRTSTLAAAGVTDSDWHEAVAYGQLGADARAAMLALRVAARSSRAEGWDLPGAVYTWTFSSDLPVSLDRCLVWLPPAQVDGAHLVRQLRQVQTGLDVLLIVVGDLAGEAALRSHCADRTHLAVAIDLQTQSAWLLLRDPVAVLVGAMARQLRVTRISPYQTRGGVSRPSSFFGREALLSRVIHREPGNYLLVGGRQLGKTSLMKAIERRLREHPQLACLYVSLRDHRLVPRLAVQCGLRADAELDAVIAHLAQQHKGKRLLLLIDEADPFFRADAANGYAELAALRAISEEGRCHFLLAGFWDLYAAAVLDYQSPLRNFGETITVAGLEDDACRELATVPLHLLNLRFATPDLVTRLVQASGRRANLVAILCHECLETLERDETVIGPQQLERALRSQAVLDALAGWGRLSQDDDASRLDRIVVYTVALRGSATLADIVACLESAGARVPVENLRRSLERLQLAFVIQRDGDAWGFAVPLFATQFDSGELSVYLAQELKQLAA